MIGYFGILEMELKSITEDLDALLRISILNPVTVRLLLPSSADFHGHPKTGPLPGRFKR